MKIAEGFLEDWSGERGGLCGIGGGAGLRHRLDPPVLGTGGGFCLRALFRFLT